MEHNILARPVIVLPSIWHLFDLQHIAYTWTTSRYLNT